MKIRTNLNSQRKRRPIMANHLWLVRSESGQALVELGLSMGVLILLVVGAAEFGRLGYSTIEVANAARAGAAYGMQNHATAANVTAMATAATNDAVDVPTMTATAVSLCACSNALSTTSTCTTSFSCSGTNRVVEYVQVTTTAAVPTVFKYPGAPTTYTLHGVATMRVEQ